MTDDVWVRARLAVASEHRDELLAIAKRQFSGGASRSATATVAQADAITFLLESHAAMIAHLAQCPQAQAVVLAAAQATPRERTRA